MSHQYKYITQRLKVELMLQLKASLDKGKRLVYSWRFESTKDITMHVVLTNISMGEHFFKIYRMHND